ncbi:MAG: aquaporin [Anaerolineales bacterium]|nr:aquaporin [Anaerolineales bacterium]
MKYKKLLAEFIGTFALVFIGAGTVAVGVGGLLGAAFAHGLVIVSIAYAYGSISGAYLNPAVTFAIALKGNLDWNRALGYVAAQLLGGAAAAALLFYILGGAASGLGATLPAEGIGDLQAVVLEAVLTFFLVNVILFTTQGKQETPFAGLAIGLTLAALILMGGPLTGASLNPARSFGPALFTGFGQFWIYVLGPLLGAALAAGVYRAFRRK